MNTKKPISPKLLARAKVIAKSLSGPEGKVGINTALEFAKFEIGEVPKQGELTLDGAMEILKTLDQ